MRDVQSLWAATVPLLLLDPGRQVVADVHRQSVPVVQLVQLLGVTVGQLPELLPLRHPAAGGSGRETLAGSGANFVTAALFPLPPPPKTDSFPPHSLTRHRSYGLIPACSPQDVQQHQ